MAKTKPKAKAKDISKIVPGEPNATRGTWANKRMMGWKAPETTMMACPRCGGQRAPKVGKDGAVEDECARCESKTAGIEKLPKLTLVDYVKPDGALDKRPSPASD